MSRLNLTTGRWTLAVAAAVSLVSSVQSQDLLTLDPVAVYCPIGYSHSVPAAVSRLQQGIELDLIDALESSANSDPFCWSALFLDDFGIGATTLNPYSPVAERVARLIGASTSDNDGLLMGVAFCEFDADDAKPCNNIDVRQCDCPQSCPASPASCKSKGCGGACESRQASQPTANDLLVEQIMSVHDDLGAGLLSRRLFGDECDNDATIRNCLTAELRRLAARQREQSTAAPAGSFVFCDDDSCETSACAPPSGPPVADEAPCCPQQTEALRLASRQLQSAANQLEDAGLFDQADQLYAMSDEMRYTARERMHKLASQTGVAWSCQGACPASGVVEFYPSCSPGDFMSYPQFPCGEAPQQGYAIPMPYAPSANFVSAPDALPPPPICPPTAYACPASACPQPACPGAACPAVMLPLTPPYVPSFVPPALTLPECDSDCDVDPQQQLQQLRTALEALERRLSR